jgi:hypothetical protein
VKGDILQALQDCKDNLSELTGDMKQLHDFFAVLNDLVGFIKESLESVKSDELSKGQVDVSSLPYSL